MQAGVTAYFQDYATDTLDHFSDREWVDVAQMIVHGEALSGTTSLNVPLMGTTSLSVQLAGTAITTVSLNGQTGGALTT